jgi:hypothetical protein
VNEPLLSVVLATDDYETIRPVVERLRRQTVRNRIELVLVALSAGAVSEALALREEFAGIRIVEDPVTDLAPARAAGIRAATAPSVFVGETHSYPHPGFAEALIAGLSGPWSSVTPAFGNANPNGALSWAGFLSDYGRWVDGSPPGEIPEAPIYNAAFRREALLALGDRLAPALAHGDELPVTLRAAGHRAYFEPSARLDHLNVARLPHWVKERFVAGILIANHRSRRWPPGRRALYILGSPLIPLVLFRRVLPGAWATVRRRRLPLMTIPLIAFGMAVKAAGELAGYAGAPVEGAERVMHEYEVHKLSYAGQAGT